MSRTARAALVLALPFAALAGCSSEVNDAVDEASARTQAEALRASLEASKEDGENLRSVTLIAASVEDLPGEPNVTGVEDTDGDGLDDDGMVEVELDGGKACVTLESDGDDSGVTDEACADADAPS